MTEQGPAQVSNPQEPYVHSGGKQEPGSGIEMPPYEDRQKTAEDEAEVLKQQQRSGPGTSDAGPRDVSQAEREGVPSTDTTGRSPLGAGQSINKQGNERMVNKSEAAQRSDQTDVGVGGASENIDPESPTVLPGNQGG